MRVTFCGAAGMVTGSCYLVEAGGLKVLVDCGMFQGKEEGLNRGPFPFHPGSLDAVILSHAHIDHSGRLPVLRKQGFSGPIYAHAATADLAAIMLLDSAHIQEMEADRESRKAQRAHRQPAGPLYVQADARAVADQFHRLGYNQAVVIGDRLQLRLQDAGHILGSSIIELTETDEAGRQTKVVFSGDLGQPGRPILRDPTPIERADYLIMESTYGNRLHDSHQSTLDALAEVIASTAAQGGKVVIPAFAVGRTQEMLYSLNMLLAEGKFPRGLKVVLDSPLAIAATQVTEKHTEVFDEAAAAMMQQGDDPLSFPGLVLCRTGEESKALNEDRSPMVIIAAGGMCDNGRVVHHLKHNLWRPESTILFVGYQAEGTLGRRILDGASPVRIHGEEVAVRARIVSLPGLSAHADRDQLLAWAAGFKSLPEETILVHGEADAREELARELTSRGHHVLLPVLGEALALRAPAARSVRALAAPRDRARDTAARRDGQAVSAERMAALLKELKAVRKAWDARGPHLPPGQAEELARRAGDVLRAVEEMRRLLESAGQ
jgi:metallo-beta-lactamase family protein